MTTDQLLAPLQPDECALVPLFYDHFDEGMLREISVADRGQRAEVCLSMLWPMLREGRRGEDNGYLREVLDLTKWSEPRDNRGHWIRLFACTGMVRMAADTPDFFEGECDTLAQFLSSAIELGSTVTRAAASLLAWRFTIYPGDSPDRAFLAFGILILAVYLEPGEAAGQWLNDLAEWVEGEEAQARRECAWTQEDLNSWDNWLLGLTYFDQRADVWRGLALRILARPARPHPAAARAALERLGELAAKAID